MTITNAHFTTILGHFSANCMFVFHKTEVQTVILRCLTSLSLDRERYNIKNAKKTKMEIFAFCGITFEPIRF